MIKTFGTVLDFLKLKKYFVQLDLFLRGLHRNLLKSLRIFIIPYIVKKRSSSGYYAINFDSNWNGFGSRVIKTLEILLYCEMSNLLPLIKFNYQENTPPSVDYFTELFYYKNSPVNGNNIRYTTIRDNDELWKEDYNKKMSLSFAKILFEKYLGINANIEEEVNLFVNEKFSNKKILGVHYRGTDKIGEAALITKETLLNNIIQILKTNPALQTIFISSDDSKIIQFLSISNLPCPVIYRVDTIRSEDGEQFHRKKGSSKSVVNRDAIINCLLLSKCTMLLKTASILSDCSVIFNPTIKVVVMSVPYSSNLTWWPATEINISSLNAS